MTEVTFLADPSARLEAAYRVVHDTRMRGLPFVNGALRVEAVAFAPWKTYWLGVMVTPWSMNLMLLPGDANAWRSLPVGDKRRYRFPAGDFDFVAGRADDIGEYLACSLFSPVLEFADHPPRGEPRSWRVRRCSTRPMRTNPPAPRRYRPALVAARRAAGALPRS